MAELPVVIIRDQWVKRITGGYPWAYSDALLLPVNLEPGTAVILANKVAKPFAIGYYNPKVKIAIRVLTLDTKATLNTSFFATQFHHALKRRQKYFSSPFYRLVHAEGDNLPGLVVDRFGDTLVCQISTAGMEHLKSFWLEALQDVLKPKNIVLRNDIPNRETEGLTQEVKMALGTIAGPITTQENDVTFYIDVLEGQKTGWFFDQRANRAFIGSHAQGKTVIDLYSYCGGFGLCALKKGATHATFVDRSEQALDFIIQSAELNHLGPISTIKENVFDALESLIQQGIQYDVVIADPPAFIKKAADKGPGLRGYQKLAKASAQLVAPHGILLAGSCSHHASVQDFQKNVELGIKKANRNFKLLNRGSADKDHPVHPQLPETHYLKTLTYQLS